MEDLNKHRVYSLKKQIQAARKETPADLVLKNGRVINVFSGTIQEKDVAVCNGMIVALGTGYHGKEEIDLGGRYVLPGMIDGHLHVESSMLTPLRLAAALLVHGTTAVVADPHEIANVKGMEGIRFMLRDSERIPFDYFFMAPSCVPATRLETSGATITAEHLEELRDHTRVLGLAEMMNFPGVLSGDEEVLKKIVLFQNRVLDGHCPGLTGHDLQAYIAAGIRSDHETAAPAEAREKLESGMVVMVREGSTAKNLESLAPLIHPENAGRFCLVSDDLHAEDIRDRGHLDFTVRKAIELGLDPVTAVRLVTRSPAEYFGLKDRGAVAPGYRADIVTLDSLEGFTVHSVYKDGHPVADSEGLIRFPEPVEGGERPEPLNMKPLHVEDLRIPHPGKKARIIEMVPGQLFTRMVHTEIRSAGGLVIPDIASDTLKLCVIERHEASGRVGLGLVRGFGLKRGALASSVAHDSHNVIATGTDDLDILHAVETVRRMGGGLAVTCDQKTLAEVPLEIAGLMSARPISGLVKKLRAAKKAARGLGCTVGEPFMALSFLALPVIPELKLTDRGLVDVNRFEIIPLFDG